MMPWLSQLLWTNSCNSLPQVQPPTLPERHEQDSLTLFNHHNRRLLRRQPGPVTRLHHAQLHACLSVKKSCRASCVMHPPLPTHPPPPPPSGLFHFRLNMDGMNEIDQLGVCWRQPCINSLGVAAAEYLGSMIMVFRPSVMLSNSH